ncbi:unnamed protein product [Pleuronectes platessa]|uniref:Uncharacterized protein n=1 Tax=Pleuronectes platessa TaxID=8262 RepID=A0A9N7U8S0_PLEPL|nr:unnamed protein product [Pleuronectes platessa]
MRTGGRFHSSLKRAKTLPRRTRSILSETGKDLAKENEKNPLRFGPAQSRRRPQRLRDQRPEARTSSTSSFRDSRYSGRARNPAKQHESVLLYLALSSISLSLSFPLLIDGHGGVDVSGEAFVSAPLNCHLATLKDNAIKSLSPFASF